MREAHITCESARLRIHDLKLDLVRGQVVRVPEEEARASMDPKQFQYSETRPVKTEHDLDGSVKDLVPVEDEHRLSLSGRVLSSKTKPGTVDCRPYQLGQG